MSGLRDEHDRDRLTECVDSAGYALLKERLAEMLDGERLKLESKELTESNLRAQQGAVRILRAVLDLPQIMITEYDSQHRGTR